MDHNNSTPPSRCDFTLTAEDFLEETSKGDKKWRRTQVRRVLVAFDEAKEVMSRRAIRELFKYLETGNWVHDAQCTSDHPLYKRIKGQSGYNGGKPLLYYPIFFVLRAIYGSKNAVEGLYQDMSRHWGVQIDMHKPFYPRLEDSERELPLILGHKPDHVKLTHLDEPEESYISEPSFTSSIFSVVDLPHSSDVDDSKSDISAAADMNNVTEPESTSNGHVLQNYEDQLSIIRNDFEQRFTEFQTQLKNDATRNQEDVERRLSAVKKDTEQMHYHAEKAQQCSKGAEHHATAALKIAEGMLERLNASAKQPAPSGLEEGRPSKRIR
ncbi:hypothetical protein FBEOM_1853 [Fusarium beomiforme]|uniref:Uncharacterized protein n=1 Tax=Fusarium beomiforme TaxID=44412 RepID=A0A9P5ASI7_9HYPO|nr:hypothetical protein FBEOM_1853 [Fusarium beomiforme]